MGRPSKIDMMLRGLVEREERRHQEALARKIVLGPPAWSGMTAEAWERFCRYGSFSCPGSRREGTCEREACKLGSRCATMAAKGLLGNGEEMARKDLPACGAKTRAGGSCAMRIVPGKARCRLHGGMSTGPKTAEGIARIREGQRRRWGKGGRSPDTSTAIQATQDGHATGRAIDLAKALEEIAAKGRTANRLSGG